MLKAAFFRLLGKDEKAVVVSFLSGSEALARGMLAEVLQLVPDREHFAVTSLQLPDLTGVTFIRPEDAARVLCRKRIGLAPTLFTKEVRYTPLRRLAFRLAPGKVLAYNASLERHHLRLRTWIASLLFLRGVPLDRIYLRPSWLVPFAKSRTIRPASHQAFVGRELSAQRPRVAILTPYFPYPLNHGGAVRIFNLIREAAREFDVFLFSFADPSQTPGGTPLLDLCAHVIVFPNPYYREPRWSSFKPAEVQEFASRYVAETVAAYRARFELRCLQVEYTQMASYAGEILVEHDVTFDLYAQIHEREKLLHTWWNWWRWHRYERASLTRYRRVVAMSEQDATRLALPHARVIPNGVDLHRFTPVPEQPGETLLFVGSFRHFPNVIAYRFFVNEVWPLLASRTHLKLIVIAGQDPQLYCPEPVADPRIEMHAFISDVRPFYAKTNLVIVPTTVSAGTNLKVIEALAMERAVVSTPSGCAGLSLEHERSMWIADSGQAFADGIHRLLDDDTLRASIAREGRRRALASFDWKQIGRLQWRLWNEILTGVCVRRAQLSDIHDIQRIQSLSHLSSHWDPESYFEFDAKVAVREGKVLGFVISREVAGDSEVLNLAVDPEVRRAGVGTALMQAVDGSPVFLEVRESNHPAQSLYTKLGFKVVGRRDEYYDNPVESALVMRLSRYSEDDSV